MGASPLFDSGFDDWNPDQLPDLTGKTYFITGANAGLGLEASKHLRKANGNILVGSRNAERGQAAVTRIKATPGQGSVELVQIDLADTASIRAAADSVRSLASDGLDAIVNNAGIMQPPKQQTADGFEMQFGTNHLGHFLMNHLLFDLVEKRSGRIVPVASIAHRSPAKLNFDDIMSEKSYSPTMAYGQSKLANIVYGLELHRRLTAAGSSVSSIVSHPGYSATNLQSTGPTGIWKLVYKFSNAVMAQSAERGAQPLALAAAGSEAKAGGYYGPTGFGDARGKIGDSDVDDNAKDPVSGEKLWAISEELLGISWTF